jgi:hypothetical protein
VHRSATASTRSLPALMPPLTNQRNTKRKKKKKRKRKRKRKRKKMKK